MAQQFTAVIYWEDDGLPGYVSYCPEVDVMTQGETIDEAKAMLKEAVEGVLELLTPEGLQRRMSKGPPSHPDISEEEIWDPLVEVERDVLTVEVEMRGAAVG